MYQCPICKSSDFLLKYDINSEIEKVPEGLTRPNKIEVKIITCSNCGLELNEKITKNFDFSKLYKKDSIYSKTETYKDTNEYPSYSKDIIEIIASIYKKGDKILEIGAFTGNLLLKLKEITDKCEGVELDPNAVSIAKSKKLNVHSGEIYDKKFNGKKYSIIIGIGLLEHIQDPVKFFKRLKELLNKDGVIVLQYPNRESLNALISRNTKHSWDMYVEPGHIYFYDKKNIQDILSSCSLKLVKYYTATILSRGKIPFLPYRNAGMEEKVKVLTQNSRFLFIIYKKLLQMLDLFRLGDTSLIIVKMAKG